MCGTSEVWTLSSQGLNHSHMKSNFIRQRTNKRSRWNTHTVSITWCSVESKCVWEAQHQAKEWGCHQALLIMTPWEKRTVITWRRFFMLQENYSYSWKYIKRTVWKYSPFIRLNGWSVILKDFWKHPHGVTLETDCSIEQWYRGVPWLILCYWSWLSGLSDFSIIISTIELLCNTLQSDRYTML